MSDTFTPRLNTTPHPQFLTRTLREKEWGRDILVIVSASLFVALCARAGTLPLPFTPVPLSLQNFAVLVVGLLLGSRRGFAALILYLAQGSVGLPVFAPGGPGGIAQLLGPTGGFLIAYPAVAFVAGWMFEQVTRQRSAGERGMSKQAGKVFLAALIAALAAEVVLFSTGITWLGVVAHLSFAQAASFALYPFFFAEAAKVVFASIVASRWHYQHCPAALIEIALIK